MGDDDGNPHQGISGGGIIMMEGHRKRADIVRGYFTKNKAVTIIAILAAIVLLVHLVGNHDVRKSETQETNHSAADENWRFYPVDLAVLGAGGGLCTVMMLREKRRAKEDLN